ncbi:MAG: LCP family protein [Chloroflexota bacterium]
MHPSDYFAHGNNDLEDTRPRQVVVQPEEVQPVKIEKPVPLGPRRKQSPQSGCGCWFWSLVLGILLGMFLYAALIVQPRTNILVLGLDSREPGSNLGRSDTMILVTVVPMPPYVGMLSIPRDLWVTIPGYEDNRINAAHFLAEGYSPGSGPETAMRTVQQNLGVDVHYFVRIRFDGFKEVINALGGIEINLPSPMSGYSAGNHHLNADQALAFVRDRQGSDDFFRMERGQLVFRAIFRQVLKPANWPRLPEAIFALLSTLDTDLPAWQWLRLGVITLLVGPEGIDTRIITREMVSPFTTSVGANVLYPRWELINPVLLEMFNQ